MTHFYKNTESEEGKFLKCCFGLPFLKPEDVGDCFAIDFAEFQPTNKKIIEFCDYLVENYISETAIFPPILWAENSSSMYRTTNACESFHAKFSKCFYSAHPHIFQFISVLLDFQCEIYIKIRSITCNFKKLFSAQTKANKIFLDKYIQMLNAKEISNIEFVKIIANRFRINS